MAYRQPRFTRPPGATELLLVRHGESRAADPANPFPLVDGQGDPELHPAGRAQAEAVAARLQHLPPPPSMQRSLSEPGRRPPLRRRSWAASWTWIRIFMRCISELGKVGSSAGRWQSSIRSISRCSASSAGMLSLVGKALRLSTRASAGPSLVSPGPSRHHDRRFCPRQRHPGQPEHAHTGAENGSLSQLLLTAGIKVRSFNDVSHLAHLGLRTDA